MSEKIITSVFEKRTKRGKAGGYASLDNSGLIPTNQLGAGVTTDKYLKGDRTWATPGGVGGGDMLKSTYDPDDDGKIANSQLYSGVDIADAISLKHSESHNHTGIYEPANANIQSHVISAHAPSNAQKNSDITKAEIEAKLTGEISSHTHSGGADGEITIVATQDTANATTTLANATGLSFTALANSTYIIEGFILWNSSGTGVGIQLSATATNSPTIMAGQFITNAANGTPDSSSYNANDVKVTTAASPFATYNFGKLDAIIKTAGSDSTWQLRFSAETTGTITIKAGSVIRYRKVA